MVTDRCEICRKETNNDLINIELNMGFNIGDLGRDREMKTIQRPICMGVTSIYVCDKCKYKIEESHYFQLGKRVIRELKKVIREDWVKNMMLEELREDEVEETT